MVVALMPTRYAFMHPHAAFGSLVKILKKGPFFDLWKIGNPTGGRKDLLFRENEKDLLFVDLLIYAFLFILRALKKALKMPLKKALKLTPKNAKKDPGQKSQFCWDPVDFRYPRYPLFFSRRRLHG